MNSANLIPYHAITTDYPLTPQSLAIIRAIREGLPDKPLPSISIEAVAGGGKTTILVEAVHHIMQPRSNACAPERGNSPPSPSILALMFSKSDQLTMEARLPTGVLSSTANGLGHRALAAKLPGRMNLNTRGKGWSLIKSLGLSSDPDAKHIVSLYNALRNAGMVPPEVNMEYPDISPIADWDDFEIENLCEHFNIPSNGNIIYEATQLLIESIRQVFSDSQIDFVDQLYIPACWNFPLRKYDWIIVDEAQDLSPLQHRLIYLSSRFATRNCPDCNSVPRENLADPVCTTCFGRSNAPTRLLMVGDPHQAIYAFRGAQADSMQSLASSFSCVSFPLSVSWRCPRTVVAEARRYVSHIQASEHAPPGSVTSPLAWNIHTLLPGAILCRNVAPLLGLATRFLRANVPFTVLGRDIGKSLSDLVKALSGQTRSRTHRPIPIPQLKSAILEWLNRNLSAFPKRAAYFTDRAAGLRILSDMANDSGELLSLIETIFSEESRLFTLCTIHKSKGREWPNVYFYESHLIPSKYAESDWELAQENNLIYVAITRAQEKLIYLNAESFTTELPTEEIIS